MLARADFHGDQVTVHNIRNCRWRSVDDFAVAYYDKTFDLDKLTSVDFIVVPFNETPSLGHTMLSFGFERQGLPGRVGGDSPGARARSSARSRASFSSTGSCTSWPTSAT